MIDDANLSDEKIPVRQEWLTVTITCTTSFLKHFIPRDFFFQWVNGLAFFFLPPSCAFAHSAPFKMLTTLPSLLISCFGGCGFEKILESSTTLITLLAKNDALLICNWRHLYAWPWRLKIPLKYFNKLRKSPRSVEISLITSSLYEKSSNFTSIIRRFIIFIDLMTFLNSSMTLMWSFLKI